MAMRTVSKTVNSGSNPGSPASHLAPQLRLPSSVMARERRARAGIATALAMVTIGAFVALAAAPGTTAALAACRHANAQPHKTSL